MVASPSNPGLDDQPSLQREVSLVGLVLYGLGTTVGAGIYALTGEVAGRAALAAPMAFLLAAVLAGLTGLGFAELAGRYPKAAGEAVFVDRAFGRRPVTRIVGFLVLAAGVVAAATVSVAFGGYMGELLDVPESLLILGLVLGLGAVASSGIRESVGSAAVITVIELFGLGLIVWTGRDALATAPDHLDGLAGFGTDTSWTGIIGGAFLAFFAFLGFEDIDAVAEETVDARRTLPRAIIVTLVVTTVVYVAVSATAVLNVDPARLAGDDAPLALVYEEAGGRSGLLAAIAGVAMVNGVLVQLVMIPRVVYGMANLGLIPARLGAVSMRTRTPVKATLGAVVVVGSLAVMFDVAALARVTSAITIAIFVAVNASLIVVKRKEGPVATFQVPAALPWFGVAASVAMFVFEVRSVVV